MFSRLRLSSVFVAVFLTAVLAGVCTVVAVRPDAKVQPGGTSGGNNLELSTTHRELSRMDKAFKARPNWSRTEQELLQAGARLLRTALAEEKSRFGQDVADASKAWNVPESTVPDRVSEMIMLKFPSAFRVRAQDAQRLNAPAFRDGA